MLHSRIPVASLGGLRPAARARSVYLPALAPFPRALWPLVGLLPVLDINGALLDALSRQRPFRSSPPAAGIFACDPFTRAADIAAALNRVGIRDVSNTPSVQLFDGETAAVLGSVGYRVEAEFRLLLNLAGRGLRPIACCASRGAVDLALGLGLRRILLHPGLASPADPNGWWAELAAHVAIAGGEALVWSEPAHANPRLRRPAE